MASISNKREEIAYQFYLIFGGALLVFGIFGNLIVIFYFGIIKKSKKKYELLILLLGIADFLAALANFLFEWLYMLWSQWEFDEFTCKYLANIVGSINITSCWILAGMFYYFHQIQKYCQSTKSSNYKEKNCSCGARFIYVGFRTVNSAYDQQGI